MTTTCKLFTPGPVPVEGHILAKGAEQLPYNRTQDFSKFTKEILRGLGYVFQTNGPTAILTGSGTAAMEAAAEAKRKSALAGVQGVKSGASNPGTVQKGKILLRTDLIRLRQTDPDRYERLGPQIEKAYREKRVR